MAREGREMFGLSVMNCLHHCLSAWRLSRLLLLVCVSLFFFSGFSSPAVEKKIPPMTDSDLLGAWVGLTSDELYYYRFVFDQSGQGLCCFVFLYETPNLYRITSRKLTGREISISVAPVDDGAYPIMIEGHAVGHRKLELTVRGDGWSRSLTLRREDDLEKRASLVNARMRGDVLSEVPSAPPHGSEE